jgi:hypothetical protein
MKWSFSIAAIILAASAGGALAQIDVAGLAEAYKAYDMTRNEGDEDTSHAALSMSLAVTAARRGILFTDEDMVRIANTWLKVMWNQDEGSPMRAAAVDGRGPHKFSPLTARWSELSQWDRKVYDLTLKAFLSQSQRQQAQTAPVMLLCAKRAAVTAP